VVRANGDYLINLLTGECLIEPAARLATDRYGKEVAMVRVLLAEGAAFITTINNYI
jgi:hypothetical protein